MRKDCSTCAHAIRSDGPSAFVSHDRKTVILQHGNGSTCANPAGGNMSIDLSGDGMSCSGWAPMPLLGDRKN